MTFDIFITIIGSIVIIGIVLFLLPVIIAMFKTIKTIVGFIVTLPNKIKNHIERTRRHKNVNKYLKNAREVQKNKDKYDETNEPILEYSREISKSLGKRTTTDIAEKKFKRPTEIKRKGDFLNEFGKEQAKIKNKKYCRAIEKWIPLSMLHTEKSVKNKTIRVFVESLVEKKAKVIDDTAVYELELDGHYDISGDFVLINLNKDGDDIKINYILRDN